MSSTQAMKSFLSAAAGATTNFAKEQALPVAKAAVASTTSLVKSNPKAAMTAGGAVARAAAGPLLLVPILGAVGFGAAGPIAGTAAAGIQAGMGGTVAAGSAFAVCQSAAMGGAAALGTLSGVAAGAFAAVGGAVAGVAGKMF